MNLSSAIRSAKNEHRLGFIVYTIPGFPTRKESEAMTAFLLGHKEVSIIESTIPVSHGFSDHANSFIRHAHTTATKQANDELVYARLAKPNLCVLYQSTSDQMGFEQVCRRASGIFDGMILEWSEPQEKPYVEIAKKYGIELVQCIGPWMSRERIQAIMENVQPSGLVYLMSAEMTGAQLFDAESLSNCIRTAREFRPDIVVAAGFGIRTAADVRYLTKVQGLDGVIIGTEFLRQQEKGIDVAQKYLTEIFAALSVREFATEE